MQTLQRGNGTPSDELRPGQVEEFTRLWSTIAGTIQRWFRDELHGHLPADLTSTQVEAIFALEDRPLRMGELAEHLGLAESSVTRLMDRLDGAGMVRRGSPPGDRRSVLGTLTPKGRRAIAAIRRQRHVVLSAILSTLDADERDRFVALHARVAEGLERTKRELTNHAVHDRKERR
jgi:DNA-binding MarR family transcriptional regulator